MPPKAKISKEMIVQAALNIAREKGVESINARTVAKELNCSTQPIMYHFATIEELKREVYTEADEMHTNYILRPSEEIDPLLSIGLNYVRFAIAEPNLFRFLFQSGFVREKNLLTMLDSDELWPVLSAVQEQLKTDIIKAKEIFVTIALFAHGYASLIANYSMDFDEQVIAAHLERTFEGALLAAEKEENDESYNP